MGFSAAGHLPGGAVQSDTYTGRKGHASFIHKRIGYPATGRHHTVLYCVNDKRRPRLSLSQKNNIPMKKFLWLVALGIIVGMIVPGILASVFVLNFLRQPNDGRYAASFGVKLAAYRDSAIFLFQAVQMERERHRPPAASARLHALEQPLHLTHPFFLRNDDGLQNGEQFRTERIAEGISGHPDGPFMMRDHLPHEVGIDVIVRARLLHLRKHPLRDCMEPV